MAASAAAENTKRQKSVTEGSALAAISFPDVHEPLQMTIAKTSSNSCLSRIGNLQSHALLQQLAVAQINLPQHVGLVVTQAPDALQHSNLP